MKKLYQLAIVCTVNTTCIATAQNVLPISLQPPLHQSKRIGADGINSSPVIDKSGNSILWVGRKKLWKWELLTNKVRSHDLGIMENDELKAFSVFPDGEVALASIDSLYIANLPNKTLEQIIRHPGGKTRAIFRLGKKELIWVNTNSVIKINKHSRVSQVLAKLPNLQPKDKFIAANSNNLLFTRKGYLVQFDYKDTGMHILQKNYGYFSQGQMVGNEIFLSTKNSINRLSQKGDLLQIVPVVGERQLISSHFKASSHAYLLSDGTLEIYNMSTPKPLSIKVDAPQTKIEEFTIVHRPPLVALHNHNSIFVYFYSQSAGRVSGIR